MLLAVADALAEHEGADQAGDAGVDVDDGAAGEVERAPLEYQAGVRVDGVKCGLCLWPSHRPGAAASALAASPIASGPAQYQTMWAIGK